MPITDIPILNMLRERMQWQQARQEVLARNVANADTPNYQAKDLAPLDFSRQLSAVSLSLDRTNPEHIAATSGDSQFASKNSDYEIRPRGNSVSHEDEMNERGDQPDGLRGGHRDVHAQSQSHQARGQRVTAKQGGASGLTMMDR